MVIEIPSTGVTSRTQAESQLKKSPRGYLYTNKTGRTSLSQKLASSSSQSPGQGKSISKASKSSLKEQQTCKTSLSCSKKSIDLTDNKKICSTDLGIEQKTGESSLKNTKHKLQKTSITSLRFPSKPSSSSYKNISIPSSSITPVKICSTDLATEHQEIISNNSSTCNSKFQEQLQSFTDAQSNIKTHFFKSFVNRDRKYIPKYKRTHQFKTSPVQQMHLDISQSFHGWLNQPSSYPSEYRNFLHGNLNYWFEPTDDPTCFTPDLTERPFVPHPHMHEGYPKAFLNTPHIHKAQSYMLPNYLNRRETISFEDHQTICATDMTETDCEGFVGVLFKQISHKGQKKREFVSM